MAVRRYIPSQLDGFENIQDYEPGRLHPVSIGDVLGNGRYAVIHKLAIGCGGFSTVWLARDLHASPDILLALKAMRADVCTVSVDEIPEVAISRVLQSTLCRPAPIHYIDVTAGGVRIRLTRQEPLIWFFGGKGELRGFCMFCRASEDEAVWRREQASTFQEKMCTKTGKRRDAMNLVTQ